MIIISYQSWNFDWKLFFYIMYFSDERAGSISPTFLHYFFASKMREAFLANGVWQKAQNIGKIQHSYLAKFSSFRVGETEWWILSTGALVTFYLAHKVWWNRSKHALQQIFQLLFFDETLPLSFEGNHRETSCVTFWYLQFWLAICRSKYLLLTLILEIWTVVV